MADDIDNIVRLLSGSGAIIIIMITIKTLKHMHTLTKTYTEEQKAHNLIRRYYLKITTEELAIKIKDEIGLDYTPDEVARIAYKIRVRRIIRNQGIQII